MINRYQLFQCNRPVDTLQNWMSGRQLLLNPPYQRGDVWGEKRRRNFIKSMLLRVPIPSIIVNDRLSAEWKTDNRIAVIDGRQRITTVLMFLRDEFSVPGDWFGVSAEFVTFSSLQLVNQRKFQNIPLAFSEGILPSIVEEQDVFDLVNFGGLRQGEKDSD